MKDLKMNKEELKKLRGELLLQHRDFNKSKNNEQIKMHTNQAEIETTIEESDELEMGM